MPRIARLVAQPIEVEVGAAQGGVEQEFGQSAFACGLARPFLDGHDNCARFALPRNDLRPAPGAFDDLRQTRFSVGDASQVLIRFSPPGHAEASDDYDDHRDL